MVGYAPNPYAVEQSLHHALETEKVYVPISAQRAVSYTHLKYGGNAMISEALRKAVISDIILLHLVGIQVVVVHGGGPEISAMLKKIGKELSLIHILLAFSSKTWYTSHNI